MGRRRSVVASLLIFVTVSGGGASFAHAGLEREIRVDGFEITAEVARKPKQMKDPKEVWATLACAMGKHRKTITYRGPVIVESKGEKGDAWTFKAKPSEPLRIDPEEAQSCFVGLTLVMGWEGPLRYDASMIIRNPTRECEMVLAGSRQKMHKAELEDFFNEDLAGFIEDQFERNRQLFFMVSDYQDPPCQVWFR
jgi:hypothetical protein